MDRMIVEAYAAYQIPVHSDVFREWRRKGWINQDGHPILERERDEAINKSAARVEISR